MTRIQELLAKARTATLRPLIKKDEPIESMNKKNVGGRLASVRAGDLGLMRRILAAHTHEELRDMCFHQGINYALADTSLDLIGYLINLCDFKNVEISFTMERR